MIEFHAEGSTGKLVLRGSDASNLVLELQLDGEVREVSGLAKTAIERMRNRASNAGKGFPQDFGDHKLLLVEKGSASLALSIIEMRFINNSYRETRDGKEVVVIEKHAEKKLSTPTAITYLSSDDVSQALTIDCDCYMMREFAHSLTDFL